MISAKNKITYQIKSLQWLQNVGCLKNLRTNLWFFTSCTFFCLKAPRLWTPFDTASSPLSAILTESSVCQIALLDAGPHTTSNKCYFFMHECVSKNGITTHAVSLTVSTCADPQFLCVLFLCYFISWICYCSYSSFIGLLFPLIWIIYHFIRFIIGEFYFNGIVNLIRFFLHLIKVHPILILKRKFIVSIDWHRNQIKDQNPKSYTYNIYIQARIQKYFPGGSNKTHCTHTETLDY